LRIRRDEGRGTSTNSCRKKRSMNFKNFKDVGKLKCPILGKNQSKGKNRQGNKNDTKWKVDSEHEHIYCANANASFSLLIH
jgi:DUF2075 family protein